MSFSGHSKDFPVEEVSSKQFYDFITDVNIIVNFFDKDPWLEIRQLINDFNATRRKCIIHGEFLTVDEVMSAWKGAEGSYKVGCCPHKSKIERKPEGEGIEMKVIADCESGILLKLDIMEGKGANYDKPFEK